MRYHSYLLFDIVQSIQSISPKAFAAACKECVLFVKKAKGVEVRAYGTVGFAAGTRFMLHVQGVSPEAIQNFTDDFLHTTLGTHLKITDTLFGMTRSSPYSPKHAPKEHAPDVAHKYLIVYPFTKTEEWHLLPYEDRLAMMKDHVAVGRKYSDQIEQLLIYSYGIDDYEFVVSYYCNSLEHFQSLVMELRGTEGRRYTKNDLPVYLGIHKPLAEVLELL